MSAKKGIHLLVAAMLFASLGILALGSSNAMAQEGESAELSCVSGVTSEQLGQAMADNANGQVLVLVRLTIAPGEGFASHTHPGTVVVSVESGTIELTQLGDMEMDVMRAAADGTPGVSEPMTKGVPVTLNPGDWFTEPAGMMHSAFNKGSEPAVLLATVLVDPNKPGTQCVEGTPAA